MEDKEAMKQMEEMSKAFIQHYYNMFDSNRGSLPALYDDSSVLTFEGHLVEAGVHNISSKLSSLPLDHCKHYISTMDCQPSGLPGGILVFVSGNLQLPGEDHLLRFSQMFHLVLTPESTYFVQNDIFRLNYC